MNLNCYIILPMKKMLLFLAVLFAILVVGCERDVTSVAEGEGLSSLTLSLPKTRTSLGEKVGVTYPVYWSEGDKISANGVESSEALIDENNPSRAQFSFPSVVNYPLNILYPSGAKVMGRIHIGVCHDDFQNPLFYLLWERFFQ